MNLNAYLKGYMTKEALPTWEEVKDFGAKNKDELVGAGVGAVTSGVGAALLSNKHKLRNAILAAVPGAYAGYKGVQGYKQYAAQKETDKLNQPSGEVPDQPVGNADDKDPNFVLPSDTDATNLDSSGQFVDPELAALRSKLSGLDAASVKAKEEKVNPSVDYGKTTESALSDDQLIERLLQGKGIGQADFDRVAPVLQKRGLSAQDINALRNPNKNPTIK